MEQENIIDLEKYLTKTEFLDYNHADVQTFTIKAIGGITNEIEKAIALYLAVRDGFRYDPYNLDLRPEALKASHLLGRNYGYCIEKAVLLAACARFAGIPSRLGFANVRNHIATEKLEERLKSNILVFHGYTELFLEGKWVKATPAFNKELCARLNVAPLEFDGKEDSVFQQYTSDGGQHMEYLHDYGLFDDMPYELFISSLIQYYPHLFEDKELLKESGLADIIEKLS